MKHSQTVPLLLTAGLCASGAIIIGSMSPLSVLPLAVTLVALMASIITFLATNHRAALIAAAACIVATIAVPALSSSATDSMKAYSLDCEPSGDTWFGLVYNFDRVEAFSNTGCLFYTDYDSGIAFDSDGVLRDAGVFVFSEPSPSGLQKFHIDATR